MNHRELIKELLKLSDEALKEIGKEGLAVNREVAEGYVKGGDVQIRYVNTEEWMDLLMPPLFIVQSGAYRIKPRTININGYEVPEPVRIPPINGTEVYFHSAGHGPQQAGYVRGHPWYERTLARGLFFYSKEDCQKYVDAILSFTKEKS